MSLSALQRGCCLLFPLLMGTAADQATKSLARNLLGSGLPVSYWHGLIQLQYIENHGGFLGYLNFLPDTPRFLLLTFGVGTALFAAAVWLLRNKGLSAIQQIVAALVLAGGTGNLLDRLCHAGGVTDFISIGLGPIRTGIFNLADVFILAGAFSLGFFFATRQRVIGS